MTTLGSTNSGSLAEAASIKRDEVAWTARQYLWIWFVDNFIAGVFFFLVTVYSASSSAGLWFWTFVCFMASTAVWEVLTGAFADIFSRRAAIVASFMLTALCGVVLVTSVTINGSGSEWGRTLATVLWFLGTSIRAAAESLLSGTEDAWLHDRTQVFSTGPVNLAPVYVKAGPIGMWGIHIGYLVALSAMGGFQLLGLPHAAYVILLSALLAVVGARLAYSNRSLPEEYWVLGAHNTYRGIFEFMGRFAAIVRRHPRYIVYTAMAATIWAAWMIFTFSIWPILFAAAGEPATKSAETLRQGPIGVAFIVVSLLGAALGPVLVGRTALFRGTNPSPRALPLIVASVVNFAPMLAVVFVLGSQAGANWPVGLRIAVVLGVVLCFRVGLVALQAAMKSFAQRLIVDNSHRATLMSNTTAAGYMLAAILALIVRAVVGSDGESMAMKLVLWTCFVAVALVATLLFGVCIRRLQGGSPTHASEAGVDNA